VLAAGCTLFKSRCMQNQQGSYLMGILLAWGFPAAFALRLRRFHRHYGGHLQEWLEMRLGLHEPGARGFTRRTTSLLTIIRGVTALTLPKICFTSSQISQQYLHSLQQHMILNVEHLDGTPPAPAPKWRIPTSGSRIP